MHDTVNYREVMSSTPWPKRRHPRHQPLRDALRASARADWEARREPRTEYALFDTPGQIEIFTWSASGHIITESLFASYPAVIVYVVDTVRCRTR